jgi:parallel beta-helix repeat protein
MRKLGLVLCVIQGVWAQTSFSPYDVNHDGVVNVADVQAMVNEALGLSPCTADLNGDGKCDVIDVQLEVAAAPCGNCNSTAPLETFTYYVDSTDGSDSNPGTQADPWKTIAKVNSTTLTPGQSVGFKRGGLWRETLQPGQSGTAGNPITFGAYGAGANPIVSGADIVSMGWLGAGGANEYKVPLATQPYVVIFDGTTLGLPTSDIGTLRADKDWYWTAGALYVYSTLNPTTRMIEAGTRLWAVDGNQNSYITFHNLTLQGTNGRSVHINAGSNWIIDNNVIELTSSGANGDGSGALAASNTANLSITNNVIRNTWNDGIYLWYPTGAIVSGNTLTTNDGPYSDNIQISGGTNSVVQNNTADQRLVTVSPKGNIILMLGSGNTVLNNICLGGLYAVTSDESNLIVEYNYSSGHTETHSYSFGMVGSPNNQLWAYNISNEENVGFYGFEGPYTGMKIYNNTVYNPSAIGLEVDGTSGSFSGELKNNIFYGPRTMVLWNISVPGVVASDYNIIGPDKVNGIYYHWNYYDTLAEYNQVWAQDNHSKHSDPLFTNSSGGDFTLSASSPAIDTGENLGSTYQFGLSPASVWPSAVSTLDQNAYGSGWEIGAYLYLGVPVR